MNGLLFPTNTWHLVFPGLIWYLTVWVVMACVLFVGLVIDVCRWGYAACVWLDRQYATQRRRWF